MLYRLHEDPSLGIPHTLLDVSSGILLGHWYLFDAATGNCMASPHNVMQAKPSLDSSFHALEAACTQPRLNHLGVISK
jgi:hypothetical protein